MTALAAVSQPNLLGRFIFFGRLRAATFPRETHPPGQGARFLSGKAQPPKDAGIPGRRTGLCGVLVSRA